MLILRFISGNHHRLGLSEASGAYLSRRGCLALMLIFNVGVESRITEVSLTTDTDIVTLHGVISGSSLSPWHKLLLTLEIILL